MADPCNPSVAVSELADYDLTTERGFAGAAAYVAARDARIMAKVGELRGRIEARIAWCESADDINDYRDEATLYGRLCELREVLSWLPKEPE